MDNQHRKIKGYRELSENEIELMNQVKALGPKIEDVIRKISAEDADKRWVSIGKTHLQQGLMALTRAVSRPDFF